MSATKIVITGGPCAGKSTALVRVQEAFEKMGYKVVVISETATELISGGISPTSCSTPYDFQRANLQLQITREKIYADAAEKMSAEKLLIICDRGALDNKAYMTEEEFEDILNCLDCDEVTLRDHYDAVFHMVTAAKGAAEAYTTANNAARTENVEQAAEMDDRLISAWTGHPHFRVIDNSTDFDGKLRRLITEIASFLGEPEPMEIERKFLIEYPDLSWLETHPECAKIDIIQTYLNAPHGDEARVRQRGSNGHYTYYHTVKRRISDLKRIELERRITENEYLTLLMDADTTRRQIRKTRYCLTYQNLYLEIDVYPFWSDKAILEIELSDESTEISVPEQIRIIKEVTDDDSYKNASLSIRNDF